MVSLQPNRYSMSTVAQYMDDVLGDSRAASNSMGSDDEPILATTGNDSFKRLKTIPVSSIHLSISTIMSFVGIVLTALYPKEKHGEAYFIMISLRAAFWLITFLFDHFLRKRHNDLRMNGYHDFHRSMTAHNGVALNVVSAWNTILLLAQAILHQYCGTEVWQCLFTPITCILAFQVSETCILITAHGFYIAKVYKFNKNANYPDALMGTNSSAGSLGIMQPGSNIAELLEKQADLIAYLKDHNQNLNQKLHQMQLNTRTSHLGH